MQWRCSQSKFPLGGWSVRSRPSSPPGLQNSYRLCRWSSWICGGRRIEEMFTECRCGETFCFLPGFELGHTSSSSFQCQNFCRDRVMGTWFPESREYSGPIFFGPGYGLYNTAQECSAQSNLKLFLTTSASHQSVIPYKHSLTPTHTPLWCFFHRLLMECKLDPRATSRYGRPSPEAAGLIGQTSLRVQRNGLKTDIKNYNTWSLPLVTT